MFTLAFLIAAVILFILSAVGVPGGRVNLQSAGLACAALAVLLEGRAP